MGTHSTKFEGKLVKFKLDSNGNTIGMYNKDSINIMDNLNNNKQNDEDNKELTIDEARSSLKNEEGCKLVGSISVMRVPGNFHISTHAHIDIISKLAREGLFKSDLSHTVNHLSFGDEKDIEEIKKKFNVGIINPIDGTSKEHNHSDFSNDLDEYYINVIPTNYIDLSGSSYRCHQFIANSNKVSANMTISSIVFRFDISPIMVKYTQYRERIFEFFIQICAIAGGIYTVFSVILAFIVNSIALFYKNKEK